MRLSGTKTGSANQYNGLGDQLYDLGGARPTLDLNFANNGSLVDSVTGKTLVQHTRASSATYVDGDGVIRNAVTNLLLQSEDFSTSWSTNRASVLTNTTTAPNGALTADKLIDDNASVGQGYVGQTFTSLGGINYLCSFYAKAAEYTSVNFYFTDSSGITANTSSSFNLNTGVSSGANASMQAVGNGWYRCFVVGQPLSGAATTRILLPNDTATLNGIYLWGAQLEQSTTVGEYIPTTGTINSAPRFDHDPTTGESLGLLVEEQRSNLCLQSEGFNNNQAANNVAITTNQVTAPDGNTTADLVTATLGGSNNTCWVQQVAAITASTASYTSSVFIKQGTSPSATLNVAFLGGTYTEIFVRFDFATKTVSISGVGVASATAGYQQYPNGWFKLWTVFPNNNTGTSITHRIYTRSEGATNVVGDSVYLWGRMTEAGAFPTSYIPTTDATATRAADVASISGNDFGVTNLLSYSEEFDQSYWTKSNGSITPNTITAPNSTFTADKLVEDTANAGHFIYTNVSWVANQDYVFSVNVKRAESGRYLSMCQRTGPAFSSNLGAIFDPADGSIVTNTLGAGYAGSESLGNGWYRCWIIVTPNASATTSGVNIRLSDDSVTIVDGYTGDGTSGIYLWGAQLEQGTTATPYIKSDVNWQSRASNATYYDSTGLLKKSSYNLLLRSEDLTLSPWGSNFSGAGVTATNETYTAPDGSTTVTKLTFNQQYGVRQQDVNTSDGVSYTFSGYVKRLSGPTAYSFLHWNSASGNTTGGLTVTDQWTRFEITVLGRSGGGTIAFGIQTIATSDFGELLVWGVQLETGTYAGDYAKTEGSAASTARTAAYLPDGNGNFVSAGELLLEDAGTNLLRQSEDFTTTWINFLSTDAANTAIAPNGTLTADTLIPDSGATSGLIRQDFSGATFTDNASISFSIYVKAAGLTSFNIQFFNKANTFYGTQTVNASTGGLSGFSTIASTTVTNVGDGWYRVSMTGISAGSGATGPNIRLVVSSTGDGTSGIYLWGAQLEASPYATSYIPTQGSTATRAADVSTSAATFGNSWYRQDEGAFFCSTFAPKGIVVYGTGDTFDNTQYVVVSSNVTIRSSGAGSASFAVPVSKTGTTNIAHGYAANNFAAVSNGGTVLTDTSGAVPLAQVRLKLGSSAWTADAGNDINGHIRRLTYWPQRLSNETLQTITV